MFPFSVAVDVLIAVAAEDVTVGEAASASELKENSPKSETINTIRAFFI